MIKSIRFLLPALLVIQSTLMVSAAGPADEKAIRNAWTLYTQQKYVSAADAFEAIIRVSTPNARLYYYSAAASKMAGRTPRAKQLCQYITTNFSTSPEATYVQKLFPEDAPQTAAASPTPGLPAHLKGKSVDELMQTEEGRLALKNAMNAGGTASGAASSSGTASSSSRVAAATSKGGGALPRGQVFTDDIVAVDGAEGITHFGSYSMSEFECSLAAMALLPKGRKMLAAMIRCPSPGQDVYIVRFPGNGGEYQVTPQKMEEYGIKDKALWATLIHCAEWMSNSQGDFNDGLSLLTGKTAEVMHTNVTTEQALIKFIDEAVKAQNPVVCQAASNFGTLPQLAERSESYTITAFDSSSGMITIRNPHGANSRRFRLKDDPEGKKFVQLNDGVFKMHASIFPRYFAELARSSI